MNTTVISHHLFVAALTNGTATQVQRTPTPRPARVARGANGSTSSQLTVEHLAAMAARYWPDFPFGAGFEKHAE